MKKLVTKEEVTLAVIVEGLGDKGNSPRVARLLALGRHRVQSRENLSGGRWRIGYRGRKYGMGYKSNVSTDLLQQDWLEQLAEAAELPCSAREVEVEQVTAGLKLQKSPHKLRPLLAAHCTANWVEYYHAAS